jgi:hypothetical protein
MVGKPKVRIVRQLDVIAGELIDIIFAGLGLHLKELAQQMPDNYDLHEPGRLLSTLSEYDHLHRLFRLCHAHVSRNIKTTHVSEDIKNKMRSLVCMEHPDFDGTLREIEQEGGKAGAGMYHFFVTRYDLLISFL